MDLGPTNKISVLSVLSFNMFWAIHSLRSCKQDVNEEGGSRIGLNRKIHLHIIGVAVQI